MAESLDIDPPSAEAGSVDIAYEETRRAIREQIDDMRALDQKAQYLLGTGGILIAFFSGNQHPSGKPDVFLGLAWSAFFVLLISAFVVWHPRKLDGEAPNPEGVWGRLDNPARLTKEALAGHRTAAFKDNKHKLRWKSRSYLVMEGAVFFEVVMLAALVFVRGGYSVGVG